MSKQEQQKAIEELCKDWKKYPSIDNTYKESTLELIAEQWVATEKIHGANFCLIADGIHVIAAKRISLLIPLYYSNKLNINLKDGKIY